jgi:hypothetical protein
MRSLTAPLYVGNFAFHHKNYIIIFKNSTKRFI